MRLIAGTANELFSGVLAELITNGARATRRDMSTSESIASHLTLTDVEQNIVTLPGRRLNYAFMIAEWLFIMSGSNDAGVLTPFNSKMERFVEFERFTGAYGPRIIEQLGYVMRVLQDDIHTRQAVLTIWRERPGASVDIPCTVSMQFIVRAGALDCITYMRSNDAWLGLPYDVFNFTQLQRYVAACIGLPTGHYHHMVGSLHLYDTNRELALGVLGDVRRPVAVRTPHMHHKPTHSLRWAIALLKLCAIDSDTLTHTFVSCHFNNLDEGWRGYIEVLLHHRSKRTFPVTQEPWKTLLSDR